MSKGLLQTEEKIKYFPGYKAGRLWKDRSDQAALVDGILWAGGNGKYQ